MKIFTPYAAKLLLPLLLFAGSLQAQTQETEQEFTSFEEVKNYMNNIFSDWKNNACVPIKSLFCKVYFFK